MNRTPGFAGIIGTRDPVKRAQGAQTMLRSLAYGGRAPAGKYENEDFGLEVGWVCPRPNALAGFPIWNEAGNTGLIILGETFDDAPGAVVNEDRWKRLIECYEKKGIACLEELNGWFGGMLIDLRRQRVFLFNDRYGLFRIHYHEDVEGFYFSSEAKAILAAVPATRQLDMRSLAEFMSCGCTLQNRSMFSGIALLPGGAAWAFDKFRLPRRAAYFDQRNLEEQPPLDLPQYLEALKETWVRILPRYLVNPRRTGLSLTGGVDSRMILAWAPPAAGEIVCYTFAGRYRDSMDIRLARQVAEVCGQPHETIYIENDFFEAFPDLAESSTFLSDGTMDVTGSVDLYVQTVAGQIAPIRVTGTNGGEIMRSLVAFKPGNVSPAPFAPEFADLLDGVAATYEKELRGHRLSFTAFKQVPWYMNTKFSLERSQVDLRMPYFDNELVALVYRAPRNLPPNNDVALKLIADGNPALGAIGTDRGLAFRSFPLAMLLRHYCQQFTFKLEYAYDYGMPQWLARLDRLLPLRIDRYILGRHKFHHFRVWYRGRLSGYLREVLLDSRTLKRPYLRGGLLEKMVRDHISGSANYTREFHRILTSELIQRGLIEQAGSLSLSNSLHWSTE